MGLIFKDQSAPADPKAARKRAIFLSIPFAGLGIFALVLFVHDGFLGGLDHLQSFFTLLGAMAAEHWFHCPHLRNQREKRDYQNHPRKREDEEKPWLKRKDWAAGRMATTLKKPVLLLWIFAIFWCGASGGIILSLPNGHRPPLVLVIFPVISLALILFVWRTSSTWRRFGQSAFEIAAVPTPIGGTLTGQIVIPGNPCPEHGWHVALRCIKRSTTGPTNTLRTNEKILWQDEKWLKADLPQKDPRATGIPVFFSNYPRDKPESTPDTGDGTHWRLEAWARLRGPDFSAAFEIPVFKVPESQTASSDPTLPYQLSLDEIRKQIHSKIQVVDLPGGKEFIFPSGRNSGLAIGATVLCVIWTAIVALLALNHVPPLLPLVFGAIDLLMLYYVFDLWLRRSHVAIASEIVKIETAWAGFKQKSSLKVSNVTGFYAETGTPVGHSTYYDLKLRTRDGKELLLAKNLGHKPEADWLAGLMTIAAKTDTETKQNE